METTTSKSMHPLTAIAAVSVTLFSLVGIGAITGLIPTSHSQSVQLQQTKAMEDPAKLVAPAQPVATTTVTTTTVSVPKPAQKLAARRAKPVEQTARSTEEPVRTARDEAPVRIAQNDPATRYEPAPRAEPARAACYDCGVIQSVREIEKKGEGSGLAQSQVESPAACSAARPAAAAPGRHDRARAIGGAVAGHAVEKNVKKVKSYEIDIRFDDGTSQLITQDNPPAWRSGDKVRLVNGVISANNSY